MEKDNEKKERKITVNTTTQPVVAIFLFLWTRHLSLPIGDNSSIGTKKLALL